MIDLMSSAAWPAPLNPLPDGVHIGLPEEPYFEQAALGSSDLIRLWSWKHGWWWQSRHNRDRTDKTTQAQNYGSALHALMLEGAPAYQDRFRVQPERPANAVSTVDDMRGALERAGLNVSRGTSGWRAADWADAMRTNQDYLVKAGVDAPCWPNILEDFADDVGSRRIVSAVEDRMLRIMHEAAMADPQINALLAQDGEYPPLAEISILKTFPDGIRRRWRIDRLYPAFTLDLKSLGNWAGRPLAHAVGDHIARSGYDIQRADYDEGRRALYEFVADGFHVHGGTLEQRAWIAKFPELFPQWDWVWLFYQKPEPTGRAPVLFPVMDEGASDINIWGAAKATKALQFYKEAVARFGLDRPWTLVEPIHYTGENDTPRVFFPHWISEEAPTEAAAYGGE